MTWNRSDKLTALSIAVAVVALVQPYGLNTLQRITEPTISIQSPTRNELIQGPNYAVSGHASHIPNDRDLWLVVRAGVEGKWYPVKRIAVKSDGSWDMPADDVVLGSTGPFVIYACLTTQTASGSLTAYLDNEEKDPNLPGMLSPPEGVEYKAEVAVIRIS